jgi:integrase
MQDTPNPKKTSARDSLQRVAEHLYRHSVHGTYYGIMTIGGKLKKKALCAFEGQAPTTDRATANRLLREWEEKLTRLDATAGDMRLEALLTKFREVRAGKAANTVATEASIISRFESEFGLTMDTMVSRVKPSDVESWLAKVGDGLRHSSYNRFRQFVRQLFQLAVDDRVVAQSPFIEHRNKAKKKQKVIRNIPTAGEFEKIIAEIRQPAWEQVKGKRGGQRPMSFTESADFAEFLGRAGLGQAEARALKWGDVDFDKRRLRIVRKKTGEYFEVPIYADLMPLLTRMKEEAGAVRKDAEVFVIKDVKRALTNACKRLKLPHFTERNLRAMKIRELYEAGVDTKTIAKWQGHKDGGKLIMEIYTEVFSSGDQAYEAAQLAKADGKVIPFSNAA